MKVEMKNKVQLILVIAVVFLTTTATQAQTNLEDALGFTETVNDVPEAPINFLVMAAAIVGSVIGIKKIKK